jgi:hypothetical protein
MNRSNYFCFVKQKGGALHIFRAKADLSGLLFEGNVGGVSTANLYSYILIQGCIDCY